MKKVNLMKIIFLLVMILGIFFSSQVTAVKEMFAKSNIALGKPTTASSIVDGYPAANAVDGDAENSRWAANANQDQWLSVNFGQSYSINRIRIKWSQTNYSKNYHLQKWTGSAWETIKNITGDGDWDEVTFDSPVNSSQLRVLCTSGASDYFVIYELEVYDTNGQTPSPTLTPTITPTATPTGDKDYVITCVRDDLNNQDMYIFGSGLENLGYKKISENTNVSSASLKSYLSRADITTVYHTGHGSQGSINTADGSLKYNQVTVAAENAIFATCLTLVPTQWKDYMGNSCKNILGYTKISYDSIDNDVCRSMTNLLSSGNSYIKAWYGANANISSLSDRWCGYVRESSGIVEYSARSGHKPTARANLISLGATDKLMASVDLIWDSRNFETLFEKLSGYRLIKNRNQATLEFYQKDSEFLQKTTLTETGALTIAQEWLESKTLLNKDTLLEAVTPVEIRTENDKTVKIIAYVINYCRTINGLKLRNNGVEDHLTLLVNNDQVVSYSNYWSEICATNAHGSFKGKLLTVGEALWKAKEEIAHFIKSERVQIVAVEPCCGLDDGLVPAYQFEDTEGGRIIVNALTGKVIH